MNRKMITSTIKQFIMQIADRRSLPITNIGEEDSLVEDLGLNSLDIATLISLLETKYEVDPFAENKAVITEIYNVKGLCDVYFDCLADLKNED